MTDYQNRISYYLAAEASAPREIGNGRAEIFHQIAKLAQNQGPLQDDFFAACNDLINTRLDCADFALAGVLRLLYLYRDHPLLTDKLREELEQTTLNFCYWYDQPGIRGMCFHTENHQILFHSCELLAGQLYKDHIFPNSGKSGQWHAEHGAARAKEWLVQRAKFGFSEWLSNCYFEEDLLALLNLYDFSEDKEVKEQAGKLIDIVLLELALHSFKGVLATTHGRTYSRWIKSGRSEPTAQINWLIFGQGELYRGPGLYHTGTNFALISFATSDYRCPQIIQTIANDEADEIFLRERHGLDVAEASSYGLAPDKLETNMFFWACQTSRHPDVRQASLEVAHIAEHPWLVDFVEGVDEPLETTRKLIEEAGGSFDGDAVNTALSAVNLVTYRTPDYQLSCAQDFRAGKPGYQQHPWHASLGIDAVVFTSHPGTDDESSDHLSRPNFWAGNRHLPRAIQHKNVLICIHHVPEMDPRPYSHAWFPKAAFDEVTQKGNWTLARKADGYIALYSQTKAEWATSGDYKDIELRAHNRDNIWLVEMGNARVHGSFDAFVKKVVESRVSCEGLTIEYDSPTLGKTQFGWTEPLLINGKDIQIHGYKRFDNPYIQTEFSTTDYHVKKGESSLNISF
ncbi:MAG: hypothetical protein KC422_06265 [Trueperaceae bacterium]|nr:hypothetical protein [Trueperaceae bacterium]